FEWLLRKIRTVYRNGSSACGAAARAMRENHRGFPSYIYPALFWRPGSPRPRLCMNVCKSLLRVATQKNPNRIPEWEQRLRRSRTRDEGKPSGFSLIYLPSVVLAAGFTPAATMYERLQIVAS